MDARIVPTLKAKGYTPNHRLHISKRQLRTLLTTGTVDIFRPLIGMSFVKYKGEESVCIIDPFDPRFCDKVADYVESGVDVPEGFNVIRGQYSRKRSPRYRNTGVAFILSMDLYLSLRERNLPRALIQMFPSVLTEGVDKILRDDCFKLGDGLSLPPLVSIPFSDDSELKIKDGAVGWPLMSKFTDKIVAAILNGWDPSTGHMPATYNQFVPGDGTELKCLKIVEGIEMPGTDQSRWKYFQVPPYWFRRLPTSQSDLTATVTDIDFKRLSELGYSKLRTFSRAELTQFKKLCAASTGVPEHAWIENPQRLLWMKRDFQATFVSVLTLRLNK